MNALNQITFLAELNNLIIKLQELLDDYSRQLTAEQEECWQERKTENRDMPF